MLFLDAIDEKTIKVNPLSVSYELLLPAPLVDAVLEIAPHSYTRAVILVRWALADRGMSPLRQAIEVTDAILLSLEERRTQGHLCLEGALGPGDISARRILFTRHSPSYCETTWTKDLHRRALHYAATNYGMKKIAS